MYKIRDIRGFLAYFHKMRGQSMDVKKNDNYKLVIGAIVLIAVTALLYVLSPKPGNGKMAETGETFEEGTEASGGNEVKPVEEGVARLCVDEGLEDMDVARNSSNYVLALNVFDRLVDIQEEENGTTRIVPALAEKWSVSEDGKTYSFTLRDDVVFSNGDPLTSQDVKFSLSRLLTVPDTVQASNADMIEGAGELSEGSRGELSGIRIIDDTHFDIILDEPFPSFISMLASPACSILSKKAVTAAGDKYGTRVEDIIGTGPYLLTEVNEESGDFVMEVNPGYWGEAPSLKRAEVHVMVSAMMDREFYNGNLDLLPLSFLNRESWDRYISNRVYKTRLVTKDAMEIVSLLLNNKMAPLDNVKVRKAIQMAIDRERIIKEVCGGYAIISDGIYPRGLIGFSEENQGWLKYDPEGAKKLLEESGIGKDYTIELSFGATADASIQKLNEILRENINAIGLNAVTVIYDNDCRQYLRVNGNLMTGRFIWMADYNDPDNFIYTFFGTDENTKRFSNNYSNQAVKARIRKARSIVDEKERLEEYKELERIIMIDEAAWVPLYSSKCIFVKGERVQSYTPYWAGWTDLVLKNLKLKEETQE